MKPPESTSRTRRTALKSLASASLLGIAGCLGGSDTTDQPTDTPVDTTGQPTTANTTDNSSTTENDQQESPEIAESTLVDDFEDISRWEVESGSMHPDSAQTYTGSQSARLERDDGPVVVSRPVDIDASAKDLSLAFRMESSGNAVPQVKLYAPDEANSLVVGEGIREGSSGNWFRLDLGARRVEGLPNLESVERLEIRIRGGGRDTRFWVDDLRTTPSPDQGYALLFFDDGLSSAYENAYPILDERDMPAAASVVTGQVGAENHMTLEELEELQSSGWEMVSHTHSHQNLQGISRVEAEREIVNAKEWLVDNGFETGAQSIVYPYGGFNNASATFASQYHDLGFRYMDTLSIGSGRVTGNMTASRGDASDLDTAKKMVDLGNLYSDLELFTFHEIGGQSQGLQMSTSDFEEFVDYLDDSNLEVITPSTVKNRLQARTPKD
ncbi:polysaccharide deacetylase family protein [Haloarchaeobius baliensis]|uniref:polysaccharide deacetylase family protein n=1 Tax=Haloarchaeobius baliensis TaxID=1670458 RepID=UPI003F885177